MNNFNSETEDPDATINHQSYADDLPPAPTNEGRLKLVVDDISGGRVLFYPCSGFDWRPILDFHKQVSTFIYCDWAISLQDFEKADHAPWQVEKVPNGALEFSHCNALQISTRDLGGTTADMPEFLTVEELERYCPLYDERNVSKQSWGRLLDVTLKSENRKIKLVFLCAEGVKTYLELFSAPRCAPQFLCIKQHGVSYAEFSCYEAALGRAVQRNPRRPKWLGTNHDHNWPWTEKVREINGMDVSKLPSQ